MCIKRKKKTKNINRWTELLKDYKSLKKEYERFVDITNARNHKLYSELTAQILEISAALSSMSTRGWDKLPDYANEFAALQKFHEILTRLLHIVHEPAASIERSMLDDNNSTPCPISSDTQPDNKTQLLTALNDIWHRNPQLRLGQLLLNALPYDDILYYMTDDTLTKHLHALYDPTPVSPEDQPSPQNT